MTENTENTETIEQTFQAALERYQAGEGPDTLIPVFKEICDRAPKNSPSWTCLSWLYLLGDRPELALKAAQKAVKLTSYDPQARINLAIAMLESGKKGVRQHIDKALQTIVASEEVREEVKQSIADGLSRKPGWKSLEKVRVWLFE